jgi:hypothetical protein
MIIDFQVKLILQIDFKNNRFDFNAIDCKIDLDKYYDLIVFYLKRVYIFYIFLKIILVFLKILEINIDFHLIR